MATLYTRSTDGSDSDNGTTWALAKATLAGVSAIDAAGDRIWVSQSHAESSASAITFAGAGTNASPVELLCGNDGAEPPTAMATTATVTTTGSVAITINGSIDCYGISFISGQKVDLNGGAGNAFQRFDTCSFQSTNTGSAGGVRMSTGGNVLNRTDIINSTFKFGATSQFIEVCGKCYIEGGSVLSGGTTPTNLFNFKSDRTAADLLVTGFDFSNLGTGFNFVGVAGVNAGTMIFRQCTLPTSWSGALVASGLVGLGQRVELHISDAANTNYRMWIEDYAGTLKSETTIVRTGGANDGTTGLSWVISTSANAKASGARFVTHEFPVWIDSTGSKTVTVEILHDTNVSAGQGAGTSSAFRDDEIWLEVPYYSSSSRPIATYITDRVASPVATPANQTSSSATWTTTGMTTPVKQALSVTFTSQQKGFVNCRVVVAKASKTIYVCPKADVT